ncbi:MAG: methyltransferase, TIGR04325 family, partial [Beijerinckiaceae bacterium]|nr:methyltransferase, TIGR04325 family [Beijerinckiaceae bacterium]
MRILQIHYCSGLIKRLAAVPAFFAVIKRLRDLPFARQGLNALTGYRRPFATFADAAAAIAGYEGSGHSGSYYIGLTVRDAEKLRPADYPALFHMQRLLPRIKTVFDLGGGIGSIFYLYMKCLDVPEDFKWRILDLPETSRRGAELAKERGDSRLGFAAEWAEASGADLLVSIGALHYFENS